MTWLVRCDVCGKVDKVVIYLGSKQLPKGWIWGRTNKKVKHYCECITKENGEA